MGQYHAIYNLDRREMITACQFGEGIKLREFSCGGLTTQGLALLLSNSNGRGGGDFNAETDAYKAVIAEVAGRWAGCRIVIQGDYAKVTDTGYIPEPELAKYNDISGLVAKALLTDQHNQQIIQTRLERWGNSEIMIGQAVLTSLPSKLKKLAKPIERLRAVK